MCPGPALPLFEVSMPSIHPELLKKWQMMGAEPVFARGTCRLVQFRKTFSREVPVTVLDKATMSYKPLILSDGAPLMAHEVLPERADLALDEDGHLLAQGEFSQNYERYLDSFIYPAGSNPRDEPVPNVVHFVKEMPDPYTESSGMIEIRFDPKLDQPFRPNQRFGPNGESEEEWKREQSKAAGDTTAILKQLAETQAQLAALIAGQKPANNQPAPAEPEPVEIPISAMTTSEAVSATSDDDRELSPCGRRYIRKGYAAQHMRHCDAPECGDGSVNSARE